MGSHEVEDVHLSLLNKLLLDSGIECIRQAPESLEESVSEEVSEESGPISAKTESAQELIPEEETKSTILLELQEESPEIFPSASLRRIIPDQIRALEEQNRIHVLPNQLKTDIDPNAIPRIDQTPQQKYIEMIASLLGCTMYKSSLAEYWFLDTMANLLRRAQEDGLDRPTQAVLMLWFCEWMKEMQHFDAADRKRMLRRWQDNMLAAAGFVDEHRHIPTPAEIGVYYKATDEKGDGDLLVDPVPDSKLQVTFEKSAHDCSLVDLTKIIHYIYDLFSTDYQYDLVRSVFTHTPDYIQTEAPYQMQNPRSLYAPLKTKKEITKKAEKTALSKGKKIPDPPEYIALMEFKAREQRILDELEQIEQEAWNRKSHILPLTFAADEELFNKYWPPPPPPPEPEPVEDHSKGKKKK